MAKIVKATPWVTTPRRTFTGDPIVCDSKNHPDIADLKDIMSRGSSTMNTLSLECKDGKQIVYFPKSVLEDCIMGIDFEIIETEETSDTVTN